tara:strand:- start:2818 stop:3594 length:777 start_codon:yes stop_codon:yes gene_type:complete
MAFGTIKADTIAYTLNGVETNASVEDLVDNANAIAGHTTDIAANTTAIAGKADTSALNAKADLDSPALTGTPTTTAPAAGDSSTQIATTAFVAGEVRTDAEIQGLADGQIAADLQASTPTIQAYDADTAKTDVAQTFSAPQRGTVTEYDGATLTPTANAFSIDLSTSNNFLLKPSATYTIALTGLTGTKGQTGSIFIKPTAAASISGSWPTTMKFVGGSAGISLTGTSASIDRIDYIVQDDSAGYECVTCNVTANYEV